MERAAWRFGGSCWMQGFGMEVLWSQGITRGWTADRLPLLEMAV